MIYFALKELFKSPTVVQVSRVLELSSRLQRRLGLLHTLEIVVLVVDGYIVGRTADHHLDCLLLDETLFGSFKQKLVVFNQRLALCLLYLRNHVITTTKNEISTI